MGGGLWELGTQPPLQLNTLPVLILQSTNRIRAQRDLISKSKSVALEELLNLFEPRFLIYKSIAFIFLSPRNDSKSKKCAHSTAAGSCKAFSLHGQSWLQVIYFSALYGSINMKTILLLINTCWIFYQLLMFSSDPCSLKKNHKNNDLALFLG